MIGNWPSAESTIFACRSGFPASTMPSTVTITSSSGNTDRNP